MASMLGGCILVLDDGRNSDSYHDGNYGFYEMWFNDASVYCEYNVTEEVSRWTLVANPDTSEGERAIADVCASIEGSYLHTYTNLFHLAPVSEGEWRVSFDNIGTPDNSYHCMNSYDFVFTAYDYDGYQVSEWVRW